MLIFTLVCFIHVCYILYMRIKERRTSLLISMFIMDALEKKPIIFDEVMCEILDLPHNQKTRSTLRKLEKAGVIESRAKNEYVLSAQGTEELCLYFPYVRFLSKKWDKKWRILSYEIPESERVLRDKLRRKVATWGLGPWHRSFWITPHPIIPALSELISGKKERAYIQAFEADHAVGDIQVLLEKAWSISKLESEYRELFREWHKILSQDQSPSKKLRLIIDGYVDVLKRDPGLPKEVLGPNWVGYEAISIFKEIKTILLSR